jgi:hypothetical protein
MPPNKLAMSLPCANGKSLTGRVAKFPKFQSRRFFLQYQKVREFKNSKNFRNGAQTNCDAKRTSKLLGVQGRAQAPLAPPEAKILKIFDVNREIRACFKRMLHSPC